MIRSFESMFLRQDIEDKNVRPVLVHDLFISGSMPYKDNLGGGSYNVSANIFSGAVTDNVSVLNARVGWIDPGQVLLGTVAPGAFLGDVTLSVDIIYYDLMQKILDSEYGYISVDGRTVVPRELIHSRVERDTSLEVRCELKNLTDAIYQAAQ